MEKYTLEAMAQGYIEAFIFPVATSFFFMEEKKDSGIPKITGAECIHYLILLFTFPDFIICWTSKGSRVLYNSQPKKCI